MNPATGERDMIRIEETVVIERPTSDVWEYITNPDNDTVWMSNVLEFEADWNDQPPRVGDTTRRVARVAGRRCEFTTEITDVVAGEMFRWKSIEAPFPFENGLRLDEVGGGTRLTFYGMTTGMRGFFGRLAEPLVARMFSRDMRSNLERLKNLLEHDPD